MWGRSKKETSALPSAKELRRGSLSPETTNGCQAVSSRRFSRRASDFSDIQYLTELRCGVQLNERQKLLIRQSWADGNCKSELPGKWVVRRLFTRYPDIRKVFGIDNTDLLKIDSHPMFIRHSEVFQNLLEMIVSSLDALDDQLGPLLISYGCKHVAFERDFGFQQEMWQHFADVMCEMPKKWRLNAHPIDTLAAWRILVLFVVTKVQQGFEEQKNSDLNDK